MQVETIDSYLPLQQNNYSGLRKFVVFYKKNLVRMPEVILEAGIKLLRNFKGKLGDEYYIILEDVFHAAIECQQFDTAKFVLKKLQEKFETAPRILKLSGIYNESVGGKEEATNIYNNLLNENPLNLEARKRKIALLRCDGETNQAIEELNKYLQENMCDKEGWLELADIYLEKLNYQKALFCYEQVSLLSPKNMHYFIKCGELLYTLGGPANLSLARNYYTFALFFEEENASALFGLLRVCKALEAAKKSDAKNKELLTLVPKAIRKIYEKKSPELLEALPL